MTMASGYLLTTLRLVVALFALQQIAEEVCVHATPIPSLPPVQASKQKEQETTTTTIAPQHQHQHQQQLQQQIVSTNAILVIPAPTKPMVAASPLSRPNNAEKLKRGLSIFINQLNPAPFFVPQPAAHHHQQQQQQQQQQQWAPSSQPAGETKMLAANSSVIKKSTGGLQPSSAEPAALINGDPSEDLMIKGPNRMTQTRPIGGPLRWGR